MYVILHTIRNFIATHIASFIPLIIIFIKKVSIIYGNILNSCFISFIIEIFSNIIAPILLNIIIPNKISDCGRKNI